MELAEKLFTLRKAHDLTQEQLAERLAVSRQSVSKWESGQAVPELDKLVALSALFDVTVDSLSKPSELDELSVKTELLERQQQMLLAQAGRQRWVVGRLLASVAVYLLFFGVFFILRFHAWEWVANPSVLFGGLLVATGLVVLPWVKGPGKSNS